MFLMRSTASQSSKGFGPLLGEDRDAVLPRGATAEDAGVIGVGLADHSDISLRHRAMLSGLAILANTIDRIAGLPARYEGDRVMP